MTPAMAIRSFTAGVSHQTMVGRSTRRRARGTTSLYAAVNAHRALCPLPSALCSSPALLCSALLCSAPLSSLLSPLFSLLSPLAGAPSTTLDSIDCFCAGKHTDFEGGTRLLSFLAGGYLPAQLAGTVHAANIHVADWCVQVAK